MYLFFDTETTGLPRNWKAPITDLDNWPRLIQIAWMACDKAGNQIFSREYIVKPQGFIIPKQASDVHGITTERALADGVGLKDVLSEFSQNLNQSHSLVAHNISFDNAIVGAEFIRENVANNLFNINKICTKNASADFCKLPGPYGYKWPKLSELHVILFGSGFEGAHDALSDVKACVKCFFELKKRRII